MYVYTSLSLYIYIYIYTHRKRACGKPCVAQCVVGQVRGVGPGLAEAIYLITKYLKQAYMGVHLCSNIYIYIYVNK